MSVGLLPLQIRRAEPPIAHLFLLRSLLLPCFIASSDTYGTSEEVLGRKEGEGPPGGARLTSAQEGARPPPQAHRNPLRAVGVAQVVAAPSMKGGAPWSRSLPGHASTWRRCCRSLLCGRRTRPTPGFSPGERHEPTLTNCYGGTRHFCFVLPFLPTLRERQVRGPAGACNEP